VYELCRWRNERAAERGETAPIPEEVLRKPPSAELRPGQLDTDSLPPYEVLDPIVLAYVEDDLGVDQIVERGIGDRETATRVASLIDRAEYKRRQAAPGVKITPKAFGRDRRLPITNRYPG
jgi:NAD+ synthase (glutamine-hydrolysing)